MNQDQFTTIASIGRSGLIEELNKESTINHAFVIQGPGDDTAVIKADDTHFNLYTSETFMEGVDFDLTYTPLHHLGYKMLAACVSDVYAMNGTPETALVNLAVPNKLSVEMLKRIYHGFHKAEEDYDIQIVGGDVTASHSILAISISVNGSVEKDAITYRKGAKEGDAICVSGDLGGALAGLRILMREKEFWQDEQQEAFQPDLQDYEYVVQRQLVPVARKEITHLFKEHNIIPHAMVDISQGLVPDLKALADASHVGAHLYQAALPLAHQTRQVADEMQEDVDNYALYGGEDLELLFMLPQDVLKELVKTNADITVIGKIAGKDEGLQMQTAEGEVVRFEPNK